MSLSTRLNAIHGPTRVAPNSVRHRQWSYCDSFHPEFVRSSPDGRFRRYGRDVSVVAVSEFAICSLRVSPRGKRLSGVRITNGRRSVRDSASHALNRPVVSAMLMMYGTIWCQLLP